MRSGWLVVLILSAGGCPYQDIGAIDDARDAKVSKEHSRYELDKRYASCDDAPAGATCGLLIEQVNLDEYKMKACGIAADDAITEDCTRHFVSTFYEQLRSRYPLADWPRVSAYCRGGAGRCDSLRTVERSLLLTHNENADKRHRNAVASIDNQARSDREDADNENFLTLAAMGVYVIKADDSQ